MLSHAFGGKARSSSSPLRRRAVKKQQHERLPAFARAMIPSPLCVPRACRPLSSSPSWFTPGAPRAATTTPASNPSATASGTASTINTLARSALSKGHADWRTAPRHRRPPPSIWHFCIFIYLFIYFAPRSQSFSTVPLCLFLLVRSHRKISGRRMVGPQGAEAITPVPLQGQSRLRAVLAVLWNSNVSF